MQPGVLGRFEMTQPMPTARPQARGRGDPPEARSLASFGAPNAAERARPYRRAGGRPEAVASLSPRDDRREKQAGEGSASACYDALASALRSEKTQRGHRLAGREAGWPVRGPRPGWILAPGGRLPALRTLPRLGNHSPPLNTLIALGIPKIITAMATRPPMIRGSVSFGSTWTTIHPIRTQTTTV
jgi:hypothetical protein